MLKVGMIGYGTIGKDVAEAITEGNAGQTTLSAILVRNLDKMQDVSYDDCLITNDEHAFFDTKPDVIIEAAGHHAVQNYAETSLRSGCDFMIVSVGAFCDEALYEHIYSVAEETGQKLYFPSAAVAGLDRIAAGAQGPIDEIKLVTRKPTKAWYGTIAEEKVDLDTVTEPTQIFKGTARESARMFPESVNVSAALSLAGRGFDQTNVEVYVDPTIHQNTHEIVARGHFGEVNVQVRNNPSPQNPKTGYIVAMSIIKVLKNLTTPTFIGL